jgi:hypothetical protein
MTQRNDRPVRVQIVHEPQSSQELAFNWAVVFLALVPIAICVFGFVLIFK